jgi:hypothetical protein
VSGLIRPLFSVLLLVLTVLGLLNVYADNSEVRADAEKLACQACELRLISESRSPFTQTFAFQLNHSADVRRVSCARSLYLVGSYSCSLVP